MKYGYQLYSALQLCMTREGMEDTIRQLAAMGYDGVEFFSYAGMSAQELKELLAENHIEGFNTHVQLERWEADPEGEMRYAAEAGIPRVTIPWMPPQMRNPEGYEKIMALARKLAPLAEKYGVQLIYHNHDFEFGKDEDGNYYLEKILDSEKSMKLELDTFWVHYAGVDPAAYMEKKRDRMELLHVKDYLSFTGGPEAGGMEMPVFCALGTGRMDNAPILSWVEENGIEWVCVEQDNSLIPEMEAAKISINMLRKYKG